MNMNIKTLTMRKVSENLENLRFDLEFLKNMTENGNILKLKMELLSLFIKEIKMTLRNNRNKKLNKLL